MIFSRVEKILNLILPELNPHFGGDWDYNNHPYGNVMVNTKSNKIVGF